MHGLETAWNKHDMNEFVSSMTEDVEWVNIVGMWWKGKAAVHKAHAFYHQNMFKDVSIHATSLDLKGVAPGVVVAVEVSRTGQFTTPNGHVMPEADNRLTIVLVQRKGKWLITSGQNTVIDPMAARFDPAAH